MNDKQILEALKRVEWSSELKVAACPECGGLYVQGHLTGCGLGKAIEEMESRTPRFRPGDVVEYHSQGKQKPTIYQITGRNQQIKLQERYDAIVLFNDWDMYSPDSGPGRTAVLSLDSISHSSWRPPDYRWFATAPNDIRVRIKGIPVPMPKGLLKGSPTKHNLTRFIKPHYKWETMYEAGIAMIELDVPEE